MSRLDTLFADYRARALKNPMTRANRLVEPTIELPGGVYLALSANL